MDCRKFIYPILLKNTPPWLNYLLTDSGVPVVQVEEPGCEYSIVIGNGLSGFDTGNEKCLFIDWKSLLPDSSMSFNDISDRLYLPAATGWIENGITLSENCISDQLRETIIESLRQKITGFGYPWIYFSPFPAGYDNVFNFRIDIDENEPDDWKRAIKALEPVKHATTWFLSVSATEKSPAIYDWLRGCDLHSHGYHHHIHQYDDKLNRIEIQRAAEIYKINGFRAIGFAPPCGRITQELLSIINIMQYQFISGLGDPNGSLPMRDHRGLWHIHSLPLSEGLYLDRNISNSEIIIQGYLSMADRAWKNNKPVLVYGHAERRLGRKPEIISRLIHELSGMRHFWHVSLTKYTDWLKRRNEICFNVMALQNNCEHLQLNWKHSMMDAKPQLNVMWRNNYQEIALKEYNGYLEIVFDKTQKSINNVDSLNKVHTFPNNEPVSLKHLVKRYLDWERETPPGLLLKGRMRSRLKAVFRWLTDKRWREKHRAKEWKLQFNSFDEKLKAA